MDGVAVKPLRGLHLSASADTVFEDPQAEVGLAMGMVGDGS